jgi:hypothetical protein
VYSILFYRGVYESEDFRAVRTAACVRVINQCNFIQVNKYEQDLVLVRDGEVTQFLDRFFKQVEGMCVNIISTKHSPLRLYQNGLAKNLSIG